MECSDDTGKTLQVTNIPVFENMSMSTTITIQQSVAEDNFGWKKKHLKFTSGLNEPKWPPLTSSAVVRGSALKAWSLRSDIGAYLVILRRCVFVAGIVRSWHNARGLCAHWSAAAYRRSIRSLCACDHTVFKYKMYVGAINMITWFVWNIVSFEQFIKLILHLAMSVDTTTQ